MAKIENLSPIVAKWEAGFINDPTDKGGATNMGITLGAWKQIGYDKDGDGDIDVQDIRLLDERDFGCVLKVYWNRWQANRIVNQSIANLLVDWVFTSGSWGVKIPQRILKLKEDGIVGNQTITAVNLVNQKKLFDEIFEARKKFFQDIVKNNPEQKKFIKGWLNRLDDFKFSETDN